MAGSNESSLIIPTEDGRDTVTVLSDSSTVFQCQACQTIIGDSSCYVDLLEEMGILVLKSFDSSKSLKISSTVYKDGIPGLSGESKKVLCASCSQQVGAVYNKGLPSSFNYLKDRLCLHVDCITSYKIPSSSIVPVVSNQSLITMLDYAIREIAKLKHVMVNFNERLVAIEHSLEDDSV